MITIDNYGKLIHQDPVLFVETLNRLLDKYERVTIARLARELTNECVDDECGKIGWQRISGCDNRCLDFGVSLSEEA